MSQILKALVLGLLSVVPEALVRPIALQYIAGPTLEDALNTADRLWKERRIRSTIDHLGEDPASIEEVEAYAAQCARLVDACASRTGYVTVSIKLSGFGQKILDKEDWYPRARALIARAHSKGVFIRFDMEDHPTVKSTLTFYWATRFSRGHHNVGVVLQSRLFMTGEQQSALMETCRDQGLDPPSQRLCIGIYPGPKGLAHQNKHSMKLALLGLCEAALRERCHVCLATHEPWVIDEFLEIVRKRFPDARFEIQWLLGVPDNGLLDDLVAQGVTVRHYVPYGANWKAYSFRRFYENPDIVVMILRNLGLQLRQLLPW